VAARIRAGGNTGTHQGAAVGRNRLCSAQESKSNRALPGSYARLVARGAPGTLMTVPQRPHTPGRRNSPKQDGLLILEEGEMGASC